MVRPVYHTQQLKAHRTSVVHAESIDSGQGQEGGGEATGRHGQGPEGIANQIVFKVILLIFAVSFSKSVSGMLPYMLEIACLKASLTVNRARC